MYKIRFSNQYKKSIRKLAKTAHFPLCELEKVIDNLKNGIQIAEKYRDHKLSGELKKYRECHIRPDLLLVYQIRDEELVLLLLDIGSHSHLFN